MHFEIVIVCITLTKRFVLLILLFSFLIASDNTNEDNSATINDTSSTGLQLNSYVLGATVGFNTSWAASNKTTIHFIVEPFLYLNNRCVCDDSNGKLQFALV